MTTGRKVLLAAMLLAPVLGTACSAAVQPQTPSPAGPVETRGPGEAGARSNDEFEAIYRARIDAMRQRFTPADVEFITMMIPHHAQAIEISQLAPKNGASAQIQVLAARIINAQKDEIRVMQTWLRDRGQPVPEVHVLMDHPPGHVMPAAEHAHDMPGMLTPAQVTELGQAKGSAFDRLFLERMIDHHRGAVTMVEKLFATDGAANDEEVFKIASDVQVDQKTEIARMELMLRALSPSQP